MDDALPKILAVDDNPKNLRVIAALLAAKQYQIDYVFHGRDAIRFATEQAYDLVLMDVMMPDLDGYETCARVLETPLNHDVPVIFLTAKNDLDSLKKGFASGGVDYLTKPFNGEELLTRIKNHLELKQLRDQQKEINLWLEQKVEERTRELNEAYSTLEKANRELLTLDEAKTEFLRMINHEIRTPLTALDGYLRILREEKLPPKISEMLDMVGKSSRRLEQFLMVVLQITELLTRDHPVEKEPVPFKELSDKAIEMNRSAIDSKKLTIRIVSDQPGAFITGNPKLLRHCLSSLLENAVEHAPEGSDILLRMSSTDNGKVLEVMDEGNGFSDLALNNLFKFFSPGSQHVDENVGLALALSKLIMDAHHGQIEAFNHVPQGATVRLTFPPLPETETGSEK